MTRGLVAALVLAACGGSTRLVAKGPHPPHVQEFVSVPFPPPPAQVEAIPDGKSDARCAWVDGHHDWDGRRWTWRAGRWVVPAASCYYASPVIAWSKSTDARLYYTPPRWYREDAGELSERAGACPAPPTCPE